MNITFWLNGVKRQAEVRPDELLTFRRGYQQKWMENGFL